MINIYSDYFIVYPLFLLMIPFYYIITRAFRTNKIIIYFSNVNRLNKINYFKTLLIKILTFILISSISISLSTIIKKNDIHIDNSKGFDISLILDASGSMEEGQKFKITKEIVGDFIKNRTGDRISLSLFADFAYIAVPLTYDKNSLLDLMNHLEVGIAGNRKTALYEALYLSTKVFSNSKSKNKIAILITDGINNVNTIPLKVAINKTIKYKIKVYTIAIGSPRDYNGSVLTDIANKTGGRFFEANSIEKLKDIYKEINLLEKSKIKINKYVKKEYLFQYSLFISLISIFLLLLLTKNRTIKREQNV
jgi:Ca-activated chloride channel family protein